MTVTLQLPGRVSTVWSSYRSDASFPNTSTFLDLVETGFLACLEQ